MNLQIIDTLAALDPTSSIITTKRNDHHHGRNRFKDLANDLDLVARGLR